MRAGLLTTPVVFLKRVKVASDYGKGAAEWVEELSTRCRVQPQRGTFTTHVEEPFYEQRLTLTLRIYHKISPEWRVLLYGVEWQQISPPLPDRQLQCQTLEIIPVNP